LTGVVSFDRRLVKIVQGSKFNVQGWNSETQRTKPSDGLNDLNEAKRWNGWNVLNPQSMAQLNTAISIAEATSAFHCRFEKASLARRPTVSRLTFFEKPTDYTALKNPAKAYERIKYLS
jgi:hypothetical protein